MIKYTLYGLIGPDRVIRYVGQTRRRLSYRLHEHVISATTHPDKGAGSAVRNWIIEIGPENLDAVVIATFDNAKDLDEAERKEVSERKNRGELLLNRYSGGIKSGPERYKICRKGLHPMEGENLALSSSGSGRRCRACLRLAESQRWQRRKGRYKTTRQIAREAGVPYVDPRSPLQDENVMVGILARRNLGWTITSIAKHYSIASHLANSVIQRYHVIDGALVYRGSRRSMAK